MTGTVQSKNTIERGRPTAESLRWRRRIRVASVGATVAAIAGAGTLMITLGQVASAATPVSAASLPLGVGSDSPPAPTTDMPADMPGMDHGSGGSPGTLQPPTMSGDMPGMDMSGTSPTPIPTGEMSGDMPGMDMSGTSPTPIPTGEMSGDMPGMDMSPHEHGDPPGAAVQRPLAPVLGTFGGGTAAVMLAAGMMRRKDHALHLSKAAARVARRSGK